MRIVKENILALSLLLSIPLLNIIYQVLNHGERGARQLITAVDYQIPFVEIFVVPYVLWYAFIFLMFVYFCLYDRAIYYRTLLSFCVGMLVCYVIYFFFQTTVPRPELVGNGILTNMVRYVYGADQPFNCFPSIHVLSSYLMILGIRHSKLWTIKKDIIVSSISYSIILSTLFVKQHVVLDVVAAVLLGSLLFKLFYYLETETVASFFKRMTKTKLQSTEKS
ncbi:phosphatase PAP2 family protein [Fictibacillus phosphorivorans]|uniref:phosphatase PAP2 family protein n=1 Tax=Fictibacillus phosphorivorans TaxID=1221500 RepID=UPI0020402DA1|nr:phosphatase PAP2 family protein [Fictibacillus phosphorivorans]MCM3717395.1 phosphatase PAP2 family protein [Fictibacillus phosphorivorans]MCM3775090.1 phosphatase PAP2 family protein [Fictibacillus phosphorivorans]